MRVKKKKIRASGWFQGKVNLFENLIFNHFLKVIDNFKNDIYHINLVNIKDMTFFFKVKGKVPKNYVKVRIGKMKTKT